MSEGIFLLVTLEKINDLKFFWDMICMVFTVSVRDLDRLEKDLRSGKKISLPQECYHNSRVVCTLLEYVPPEKVPEISQLAQDEKKSMSDVVAYAMRPDLIKQRNYSPIGPKPLNPNYPKKLISEKVTLKNSPDDLKIKGWEIPDEYMMAGSELFRCLGFARAVIPSLQSKFKYLPFNLAGSLSYLMSPEDLTDYLYTKREIDRFHRILMKEAMTV